MTEPLVLPEREPDPPERVTTEQMTAMLLELCLGKPPSLNTPEAARVRAMLT